MVQRSIEQDLRTRSFAARNGRIESNMLVKSQREQRHVLDRQDDFWQWNAIGQCSKGNNCSFRYDTNKRAQNLLNQTRKIQQKRKVLEAEARLGESIACHAKSI